jgi:hypothetical protein
MVKKSCINDTTQQIFDFLKQSKGREVAMANYTLQRLNKLGIREIKHVCNFVMISPLLDFFELSI